MTRAQFAEVQLDRAEARLDNLERALFLVGQGTDAQPASIDTITSDVRTSLATAVVRQKAHVAEKRAMLTVCCDDVNEEV